jgi:hypothetical protein
MLYSETALNDPQGFDDMTTYSIPEIIGNVIYTTNDGGTTVQQWTIKGSAYLIGWEDIVVGDDLDYGYDDMM